MTPGIILLSTVNSEMLHPFFQHQRTTDMDGIVTTILTGPLKRIAHKMKKL